LEALKAQAVASRTFAKYQMERNGGQLYDLDNTVRSQVYAGSAGVGTERVKEAVESTRGIIAVYDGAPAGTFYHSSAGGRTENPGDVWGRRVIPYLVSQPALFEDGSPHYSWRLRMSHKEISHQLKKAGISAGTVVAIETVSYTSSGRVGRLRLLCGPNKKKMEMRGEYFRKIIGDRRLPSTKFKVSKDSRGNFTFAGQGYGHGVGMSQWSARGLAERGRGYEEILQAFYPGVALEPIFKEPSPMEEQIPSPEPSEPVKEETLAVNTSQPGESRFPDPIAD
jgi:stage II sporulation protein D